MLSSIHPLGERARNNRWWVTVSAFAAGAMASGAVVGGVLGLLGSTLPGDVSPVVATGITAAIALAAGLLDLSSLEPPGPERQVNETWIGAFRGWVYGGGFGIELGAGLLTYVVTWAVYAMYAAEFLSASAWGGALVGAIFGLGRSSTLLLAGVVDRPSRLTSFNRALAKAGPLVRRGTSAALAGLGMIVLAVGLR